MPVRNAGSKAFLELKFIYKSQLIHLMEKTMVGESYLDRESSRGSDRESARLSRMLDVGLIFHLALLWLVSFGVLERPSIAFAFTCSPVPPGQITDANVQARLRLEKSNASALALEVKAAYGKDTAQYRKAKALYTDAQERYNAFTSTMLDNYRIGQAVNLTPTAMEAARAGQEFCNYVNSLHISSQGGAELILTSLPALLEVASKLYSIISTRSADKRVLLADSLQPQITWPSWDHLS